MMTKKSLKCNNKSNSNTNRTMKTNTQLTNNYNFSTNKTMVHKTQTNHMKIRCHPT